MGTNMYPSAALLGQDKDESTASIPVDELIEKADGFAGVFPGEQLAHKKIQSFAHTKKKEWMVRCPKSDATAPFFLLMQSTSMRL
jgi:hypothetical protein